MSTYLDLVLTQSQTRGYIRVLMAAVAFYHDQHGAWPERRALPPMVNETGRQCDKLIDYATQDGELIVIPHGEFEVNGTDVIALNVRHLIETVRP